MNNTLFPVFTPFDAPGTPYDGKVGILRYSHGEDGLSLRFDTIDPVTAVEVTAASQLNFLMELDVEATVVANNDALVFEINKAAMRIAQHTRRGAGNVIVANENTSNTLNALPIPIRYIQSVVTDNTLPDGVILIGYIGGQTVANGSKTDTGIIRLPDDRVIVDDDSSKYYQILLVQ